MIRSAQQGFRFLIAAVLALAGLLLAPGLPGPGPGWGASVSARTGPPHRVAARPALQQMLDEVVAAGAPGVVALVNDGRRGWREDRGHGGPHDRGVWQDARGVADLGTGRAMRPEDRFRAGSVTKSFVATVALQLVAEGRLSLSDSVERWLPGVLPYGGELTVRQLLSHTGGVPEYNFQPVVELFRVTRFHSWQPRELVALIADLPPDFVPGTAFSYSNTGYVLMGMIIERVTGRDLGRELERRIFRPLQLRGTSFPVNLPFLPWPYARGYSQALDEDYNWVEGRLLDFTVYNPSWAWGPGNVVSDVDDIARFYRALLGGRLLPPALLAEMKATREVAPGVGYGLGLTLFETACGSIWGHEGTMPGFATEVFSSDDGTRQYGVMINAHIGPAAMYDRYWMAADQARREAFAGMPCATGAPTTGGQQIALDHLRATTDPARS